MRTARDLGELLERFGTWLYLEPSDYDAIQVCFAAALDRELPGDPCWLFLVAPSGAIKTELIRSLGSYSRAYSLDTLTPHSLVSGQAEKDKETGEYVPIAGILQDLDGKVLLLKDFTSVLSESDENRTTIYGQLRACYDGYFEKAFGTMRQPIRVKAMFGLMAGVTPIIDRYTKMTGALGERFLMVRMNPDRLKAARRASRNTGRERVMRSQLRDAVADFIGRLDFTKIPTVTSDLEERIIRIGCYIAYMRSKVFANYSRQGDLIDMDPVSAEVPTRVSKQLKKLGQLLAVIRGRDHIGPHEFETLSRVARDTSNQRRQRIMDVYQQVGLTTSMNISDLTGMGKGLHYRTVRNELEVMTVLEILNIDEHGNYKVAPDFMPYVEALHAPTPPITSEKKSKNGLFSEATRGEGAPPLCADCGDPIQGQGKAWGPRTILCYRCWSNRKTMRREAAP